MTIEELKKKIEEIISQPPTKDCRDCIGNFASHISSEPISNTLSEKKVTSLCLRRLLKTIADILDDEKVVTNYVRAGCFSDVDGLCGDIDTFRKVLKMIDDITGKSCSISSMEIE